MAFERYLFEVPWSATSLQVIESIREDEREQSFEVQLARPAQFVIANLSVKELRPLVPQMLRALDRVMPGELIRVGG